MSLAEVDLAVDRCQKHVASMTTKDPEIESFLTVYVLIRICGAFEKEIQRLVIERANQTKDKDVVSFVKHTMETYRGLLTSDLKGLLRRFGDVHGDTFDEFLLKDAEVAQRYQNIVLNRHSIAHGTPITITLEELIASYPESKKVIDKMQTILGV